MNKKRKNIQKSDDCIWELLYDTTEQKNKRSRLRSSDRDSNRDSDRNEWISATKTKNYILNDTCIDWLEMYYHLKGVCSESSTKHLEKNDNLELLFEGGHVSESKLYDELKEVYGDDFEIVFTESDYNKFRKDMNMNGWIRERYNHTVSLMERGVPLIGQAVMINDRNKTYGIADILIRSDYLENLFDRFVPDPYINYPAPNLTRMNRRGNGKSRKYHYRVIDYKWSTMILCVDGTTVRNNGRFPAYKGQLAIYTACLEQMQGYAPTHAYLMCKGWKIDRADPKPGDYGYSCFDRPGVIDYKEKDRNFIQLAKQSLEWIARVRNEGIDWEYGMDRPTVDEMYPNMNKQFNPAFSRIKQELAERYNDVTQIWYLNQTHREIARKNGITSCKDPRLTAGLLGIDGKRSRIIDQIILINRDTTTDMIQPQTLTNDLDGWQKESTMEYYVDMETINMNLYMDPQKMDIDHNHGDSDVTFMIGIGFRNNPGVDSNKILDPMVRSTIGYHHNRTDDGWEFVCLYLQELDPEFESDLYLTLYRFMRERRGILNSNEKIRFFHWTPAELRFMEKAHTRIKTLNWNRPTDHLDGLIEFADKELSWIDLCNIFQSEPIVIKGAYRYKLKSIARAMHNNRMISTLWKNDTMSDGFSAMICAIRLYRTSIKRDTDDHELCDEYAEIVRYNEIDCKVMWEIVNYLRTNHCNDKAPKPKKSIKRRI